MACLDKSDKIDLRRTVEVCSRTHNDWGIYDENDERYDKFVFEYQARKYLTPFEATSSESSVRT